MNAITSEQVAGYLQEHPEFFEQHADMLAEIYIPHPHGGRAIPISERQILTLRERSKQLEGRLREVMQYGEENDAIGEKVHRLAVALLGAQDLSAVCTAAAFNLREDFAVPHVALKVWGVADGALPAELGGASDALRGYVGGLAQPACGAHLAPELTAELFGAAAGQLKSYAVVALVSGSPLGALVLASEDPQRFYPEMGHVFVRRIGEMIAAALSRHSG